jgi:hypothetical protein
MVQYGLKWQAVENSVMTILYMKRSNVTLTVMELSVSPGAAYCDIVYCIGTNVNNITKNVRNLVSTDRRTNVRIKPEIGVSIEAYRLL